MNINSKVYIRRRTELEAYKKTLQQISRISLNYESEAMTRIYLLSMSMLTYWDKHRDDE